MAIGTFKQELNDQKTAKYVLKQNKKRTLNINVENTSNYSSKAGLIWTEEKKLDEIRRESEGSNYADSPRSSFVRTNGGLLSSQRGSFFKAQNLE